MWPATLAAIAALANSVSALLVASGSPCSQYCGNVLSNTSSSDMTCTDSGYGSAAGIVFESCIGCELTSNYTTTDSYGNNQTDLHWLLYNLRYTVSYCVFGEADNTNFQDNPCLTSTACGPLLENVFYDNLTQDSSTYGYCQNWDTDQAPKCTACLNTDIGMDYLSNYVTILDAACQQEPADGSTVSIQGSPFSTTQVNITTPTPSSTYTFSVDKGPVSLGGKVGIAIGGVVFLLVIAGFAVVCRGRRKRRAYLRSLEGKHGKQGIFPSPINGFPHHDMTETPMSQKPLRGWDDNSPISASTERSESTPFPSYFSPYNSQYNSPISARDTVSHGWPQPMLGISSAVVAGTAASGLASGSGPEYSPGPASATGYSHSASGPVTDPVVGSSSNTSYAAPVYTQEEIERMAHEHELAQIGIGIAMGGSDPSLRSKSSNIAVDTTATQDLFTVGDVTPPPATFQRSSRHGSQSSSSGKSKGRSDSSPNPNNPNINTAQNESYELVVIDSSTGSPVSPQQTDSPVVRYPLYGQAVHYPRPPSPLPYDGLTEDDAKAGRAI